MPYFDAPLDELRAYRTAVTAPDDLDAYWEEAIADAGAEARPAVFEPHRPDVYRTVEVYDVTFTGAGGDPVRGWFLCPPGRDRLPCRVTFIGYGGGRGHAAEHTLYAAAGFAELVVDSRAQGGSWRAGDTGDPGAGSAPGPEAPGVMTRGILDRNAYYYRRLYVDAVRAVETAAAHPQVDADRICVSGASQGGGLSLAAAALAPELVRLCHADIPFLCDIERAITLAPAAPYTELAQYLRIHTELEEIVARTVRYIDNALLATRIRCRTLISCGLMDDICPPSTVFAAYNAIEASKDIWVATFGSHETPIAHQERQLKEFAAELG